MARYKMTPAIRAKISASQKQRFAKAKTKINKAVRRTAHAPAVAPINQQQETPRVIAGEYVGERAVADITRIEDRAFRRGMFTALKMVVDVLIRELL